MNPPAMEPKKVEYDPCFVHSRREALVILCLWLVAMLWAVPFCHFNGYVGHVDPENVKTIWGIPSWLFWGIAVPWIVADLFTVWFCFFFMQDDDLGEVQEGSGLDEDIAERHVAEEKPA